VRTRLPVTALLVVRLFAAEAPNYAISTFAGTMFSGEGRPAASVALLQPQGIAVGPDGSLYIAEAGDHRIRRVAPDGTIRTIIGTGDPGTCPDGTQASLCAVNAPYGVALAADGTLYFTDLGNGLVRKMTTGNVVVTIAGGGKQTFDLPSSPTVQKALELRLSAPRDVAVGPTGRVYFSDFSAHRVYEVDPGGNARVAAGTGRRGTPVEGELATRSAFSFPAGVAVDKSNILFIADSGSRRVYSIRDGVITVLKNLYHKDLEFMTPTGVAAGPGGTVYVADGGGALTSVEANGNATWVPIGGSAVAVAENGVVYGREGAQVKSWDGTRTEFLAGVDAASKTVDGIPQSEWRFTDPAGLAFGVKGELFLADPGAGRVYRIDATMRLETAVSGLPAPYAIAADAFGNLYIADKVEAKIYRLDFTGNLSALAGHYASRPLVEVTALTIGPDMRLYIADTGGGTLRRLEDDGTLRVIAGGGGAQGDAPAMQAKLQSPAGLAFDPAGNLWFTEAITGRIRKLTPQGRVESLPEVKFQEPRGIRADAAGNLFVADATSHQIYRISPGGAWHPIAGSGGRGFTGDGGPALEATLHTPLELLVEPGGSILVADSGSRRVRRLTPDESAGPVDGGEVPPPPPPPNKPVSATVRHYVTGEAAIAPGQLVRVGAEDLHLATDVQFGGLSGSIVERNEGELTVRVPGGLRPGTHAVRILSGERLQAEGKATTVLRAPALLTSPNGEALALNENATLHGPENPAALRSVIVLYGTGEGPEWSTISVEIGGFACEVVYAGEAPGMPGIFQINARMPSSGVPSGPLPVRVLIDGEPTPAGVRVFAR
jgi:uncharacterized protein (TIGR03437 family)